MDVVIARLIAQNFLMVKMAGRSFGRKKNYGLTVNVFSKPWWTVNLAWRNQGRIIYISSHTTIHPTVGRYYVFYVTRARQKNIYRKPWGISTTGA